MSFYVVYHLGAVDISSTAPTYRGLTAVSRDLLDTAVKPRYVGTLEDLRK